MEKSTNLEVIDRPEHQGIIEASEIVDRLGIEQLACELIENRDKIENVAVPRQEREDNARTALMEALTASGHLSRVELTGSLEEINAQVLSRLLNGWSDNLNPHEKQRRFVELCNELTIQEVHRCIEAGMLPESVELTEISDYPMALSDKQAERLGYRPENKKGMVRTTGLVKNSGGTYTRVIEQVSRSSADSSSTFEFMQSADLDGSSAQLLDVEALGRPLLTSTVDYADGVIDIQRRLDKHSGGHIYGEKPGPNQIPYEDLREESFRRERRIEFYTTNLADFETRLDQAYIGGLISKKEKDNQFKQEVRAILEAICTLTPEYAEDCFGGKAAATFFEASNLAAAGQLEMARQLIHDNRDLQKPIVFCGMSISPEKAKELGLNISETGDLISEGKEKMKFKPGVCRIKSCAKKTDVGPCSICRNCQSRFDKGDDPTLDIVSSSKTTQEDPGTKTLDAIFHYSDVDKEPHDIIEQERVDANTSKEETYKTPVAV